MKAKRRTVRPKLRKPDEARAWLRHQGLTVVAFAELHNVSRHAVNDALRGVAKGNFGQAHAAAVALGMKAAPDSGTNPIVSAQARKQPKAARKKA